MQPRLVTALVIALGFAQARPAAAALCYFDSRFDGTGVPVRWFASPIPYYVNASRLPQADRAAAIAAVQAAFASWELSCTSLKFQYAGASTEFTWRDNAINVFWGDDATSWPHGSSAYWWYYGGIQSFTTGEMIRAYIGMNAADFQWSASGAAGAWDIQTAVTRMIPGTIGFFVGPDPNGGGVGVTLGQVDHTLTAEHEAGARFTYFQTGPGCTQTPQPAPCELWNVVSDGGALPPLPDAALPPDAGTLADQAAPTGDQGAPAPDGATPTGDSATPTADGATPAVDGAAPASDGAAPAGDGAAAAVDGATATGDGGAGGGGGGGDDGGCCSTSHARSASQGALFALACLALLILRRRPR